MRVVPGTASKRYAALASFCPFLVILVIYGINGIFVIFGILIILAILAILATLAMLATLAIFAGFQLPAAFRRFLFYPLPQIPCLGGPGPAALPSYGRGESRLPSKGKAERRHCLTGGVQLHPAGDGKRLYGEGVAAVKAGRNGDVPAGAVRGKGRLPRTAAGQAAGRPPPSGRTGPPAARRPG